MLIGWLTARELINTGLFVGDLCVLFVLARVLWDEIKTPGWLRVEYNQAILAFIVYFFGMTVTRAWAAVLLWQLERGGDIFAIENSYPISMFGSLFAFLGVLLIVRRFSPARWGKHTAWAIVLTLTVCLTAMAYSLFNVPNETDLEQKVRIEQEIDHLIGRDN